MNILYVEDDCALRYSISREMRAHGHHVFEAASAEAALVLLAEHDVEALVADIGLPGQSGEVFAAEALSVRPLLRLVFATGLARIKRPPASDPGPRFLRKPYTWQEMSAALA